MYFATKGSQEGFVGPSVLVEFIPPSLVAYNREVLQSFFDKDKAVMSILVL